MKETELSALVAQNIRRLAEDRGLALNSLADFAGVSRSQLYDVLAGRKGATLEWIARIAAALEVEPWELLYPGE